MRCSPTGPSLRCPEQAAPLRAAMSPAKRNASISSCPPAHKAGTACGILPGVLPVTVRSASCAASCPRTPGSDATGLFPLAGHGSVMPTTKSRLIATSPRMRWRAAPRRRRPWAAGDGEALDSDRIEDAEFVVQLSDCCSTIPEGSPHPEWLHRTRQCSTPRWFEDSRDTFAVRTVEVVLQFFRKCVSLLRDSSDRLGTAPGIGSSPPEVSRRDCKPMMDLVTCHGAEHRA